MRMKRIIYLGLFGIITSIEANALCIEISIKDDFFKPGYSLDRTYRDGIYIYSISKGLKFVNSELHHDIRALYMPQEELLKHLDPNTQLINSPTEDELRMSSPYSVIIEYTSDTAPSGVLAQVHVTDKNIIDKCFLVDRLIVDEEGLQEKIRASVQGLKKFRTLQVYLRAKPHPYATSKDKVDTLIPCGDKSVDVVPEKIVVELDRKKIKMANGAKALDNMPTCRVQIQK